MHDDVAGGAAHDAPASDGFAGSLQKFASGLSPTEHAILVAALNVAMGPWKGMAARPARELLDPAEARLVDQLMKQPPGKET
ncbi:hypothetical protein ACF05T_20820 [Streptomyces lateritius]|uniref:Uncharacterized protein n=1 Tax=Streptomyces lateritius TaxID=67313 RepID=A0ABW6YFA2_9ACTN